jgi:heme exporter protein C
MHGYANPTRFLKFARPATGWLLGAGSLLLLAGVWGGLAAPPAIWATGPHPSPSMSRLWLGMAGWAAIAAASISQLVWRHPLAAVAGRAIGPPAPPSQPCAAPPVRSGAVRRGGLVGMGWGGA